MGIAHPCTTHLNPLPSCVSPLPIVPPLLSLSLFLSVSLCSTRWLAGSLSECTYNIVHKWLISGCHKAQRALCAILCQVALSLSSNWSLTGKLCTLQCVIAYICPGHGRTTVFGTFWHTVAPRDQQSGSGKLAYFDYGAPRGHACERILAPRGSTVWTSLTHGVSTLC